MALMLITTLASVTRYTLLWSFRKLGQVDNRIYYIVCGCSVAKNAKAVELAIRVHLKIRFGLAFHHFLHL